MADGRYPDMSAVDILKTTQQRTELVWCEWRWGCILAPPGECGWIVCVRRRCGLLSNYFNHLFVLLSTALVNQLKQSVGCVSMYLCLDNNFWNESPLTLT